MKDQVFEQGADLQCRIWNQFSEMPGLRLTLAQSCRLLGTTPGEAAAALQALVDCAVLRHIDQYYMRADIAQFTH